MQDVMRSCQQVLREQAQCRAQRSGSVWASFSSSAASTCRRLAPLAAVAGDLYLDQLARCSASLASPWPWPWPWPSFVPSTPSASRQLGRPPPPHLACGTLRLCDLIAPSAHPPLHVSRGTETRRNRLAWRWEWSRRAADPSRDPSFPRGLRCKRGRRAPSAVSDQNPAPKGHRPVPRASVWSSIVDRSSYDHRGHATG